MSIKLNFEDKFLISLLFSEKKIPKHIFLKLNLDNLIKISSQHLIIPCLYTSLRNKGYLSFFEKQFCDYIKYIYEKNLERNLILRNEIFFLSKILRDNNIDHLFLKGSALILNNVFEDIGERMVGDIDFLISKDQEIKVAQILEKNKYLKIKDYIFEFRHLPRRVNKKKLFAIEPHLKLISSKKKYMIEENVFKSCINKKTKTPNHWDLIYHSIYNQQINDNGNYFINYNYRNIYDVYSLMNKYKIKFEKIEKTKFIKKYFKILSFLNIHKAKSLKYDLEYLRFKFRYKYKLYSLLENKLIKLGLKICFIPKQVNKFVLEKSYRQYIFKRLYSE